MNATYGVRLKDGSWFNAPIPTRTTVRHGWAEILEHQNHQLNWERAK